MRTYVGYRAIAATGRRGEALVMILDPGQPPRPLGLRLDLAAHSPTGPEWGYAGSGPAQLAHRSASAAS